MRPCSLPCHPQLRRGTVTPLTILCLALLVGVTALVIDGGTLMEARRHVQAAADAAALAGADDLYANYLTNQGIDVGGTAQASALATASANGFTNDGVQSIVTVNTSPQKYQSGPNAGKTIPAGYIEVVIQYNATHLFSGVFGSATSPVLARAVARGRGSSLNSNGVTALNLSQAGALNVSSTGGLTVSGGIAISSSSSSPLQVSGSGKVTATQFILNPAMTGSGGGGGGGLLGAVLSLLGSVLSLLFGPGGTAPNILLSPAAPDPLRFLPAPDVTQLTTQYTNLNITSGTKDLYPGVYNGGIKASGLGTQVILHANSDGTPGIYYLNGPNGLQVTQWATVKTAAGETAGIMIYNNWSGSTDTINVNTFGSLSLFPPATGLYRGLTIFQKRGTSSSPAPPINLTANGTANVTGTIYAASASVSLATNLSTNVLGGQVIADTVNVGGLANVHINPGTQPTATQRQLGLVE
jgi:Flp pilus assembly protein TadG